MTVPANLSALMLGNRSPVSLEYINRYFGSGGGTGNVTASFGDAAGDRHIVIHLCGSNGAASVFSAVTIGGVSATEIVSQNSGFEPSGIWLAFVPAGVSGSITWTLSGGPDAWSCAVYRLTKALSPTPVWTGKVTGVDPASFASLSVPDGAAGLFGYITYTGPTGITWSSNVTQDYFDAPQGRWSAARLNANVTGLQTVTADWVGTVNSLTYTALLGAIWR